MDFILHFSTPAFYDSIFFSISISLYNVSYVSESYFSLVLLRSSWLTDWKSSLGLDDRKKQDLRSDCQFRQMKSHLRKSVREFITLWCSEFPWTISFWLAHFSCDRDAVKDYIWEMEHKSVSSAKNISLLLWMQFSHSLLFLLHAVYHFLQLFFQM